MRGGVANLNRAVGEVLPERTACEPRLGSGAGTSMRTSTGGAAGKPE